MQQRNASSPTPVAAPDAAMLAFSDSPLPVVSIDLERACLADANAAAAALYGLPLGALAGRPLAEVLAPAAPQSMAEAVDAFLRQAASPEVRAFDVGHRRADGQAWVGELRVVGLQPGPPRRLLCTLQDVTAQRADAQALRRIEQRYLLAARIGRAAAWEMWPAEQRIFCDASLTRLMGYEPEDLGEDLGPWLDTVPEEARETVRAALRAVVEGHSDGFELEHAVRRKDGRIGWVHVQCERVSAPGEVPIRLVGSTVDITERKRFERQLRLTQFAVDQSPDAIFWIDDNGRVVRANERAARSLGLSQEELKGRPIRTFDPDLEPDGWARVRQRMSDHGSVVFETRHRHVDGTVFPVEVTTSLIHFEGKAHGFCVVRDISERRRTEQALREANAALEQRVVERTAALELQSRRNELILSTANDGFFTTDLDGRVRDPNAAFCRLLGYTAEELSRLSIPDIEGNESPREVAAHIERIQHAGHDRFDTRHRRKDGSLVDVEISITRVDLADRPLQFAFVREIGERKRAEQALRQAKDEAERANRAKSEFLSRMSHELRTPLNAILGFGQLLELKLAEPRDAAHVHEILTAGRHLLTLIDEVLDLARVESGHLTVSPEPVAVGALAEECLTLLRPQASAAGIRLLDVPTACRVHVRADRTRLKQVLLNLLSNAIKYNRTGGAVHLTCDTVDSMVCLRIHDTGPGLTAEQQARLFVPFERLDADERRIQGTGIGLALSKRLAELMGGRVGVHSVPGAGSEFWVCLPPAPPPGEAAVEVEDDASPADAPGIGNRRDLLCIEDNPANLRLIEGVFARRNDLRLLSAMAPGLGLELARNHRPAVILLDIHLPDMDGYEVLRCLREHASTRDIPVVAVSANAMPRDIERAKAAGFHAYLTKPLDIGRLLRTVDELLRAGDR